MNEKYTYFIAHSSRFRYHSFWCSHSIGAMNGLTLPLCTTRSLNQVPVARSAMPSVPMFDIAVMTGFKTHKRLKDCFLIGRNRTKRAHFRGSPLFQATYNIKTEKQNNLFNLSCVRWLWEAGGRKRARDPSAQSHEFSSNV